MFSLFVFFIYAYMELKTEDIRKPKCLLRFKFGYVLSVSRNINIVDSALWLIVMQTDKKGELTNIELQWCSATDRLSTLKIVSKLSKAH